MFFMQKTEYDMRISDWSSDVCSSDLLGNSALAMDVYLFLCARLHRINRPTKIYWHQLQGQFGQEYIGANADKDFKRTRSEERRVGKQRVSTCRSRGSP